MPEEIKEEKKETPSPQFDEAKLAAAIANGLKPVVEGFAQERRPPSPPPAQPTHHIERPSERAIAQAQIDGNVDLLAQLLKQKDDADKAERQREIGEVRSAGTAAFGSVAKLSADRLDYYKRFKKEIDQAVDEFASANPSTVIVPEHYAMAHDVIVGRHMKELRDEAKEEAIRQAREPVSVVEPGERLGDGPGNESEREPTGLQDVLAGDWRADFRTKQRGVGGRTEDEELRKFGYKGGLKEFVAARKENEKVEDETNGSFGLDRDWDKTNKVWID